MGTDQVHMHEHGDQRLCNWHCGNTPSFDLLSGPTLASCLAFLMLAVPRKEMTMWPLPHAIKHLVPVMGSRIRCMCCSPYSCMAVSSDSRTSGRPCSMQHLLQAHCGDVCMDMRTQTSSAVICKPARHHCASGGMCATAALLFWPVDQH